MPLHSLCLSVCLSLSLSLSLSTEPLTYRDKLTSHLQGEEGDRNLLEITGMEDEAILITDGMTSQNILEKRALVAKRKAKARKELMKVMNILFQKFQRWQGRM